MHTRPRQPECAEPRLHEPHGADQPPIASRLQRAADRLGELQLALEDYARKAEADARFDLATGQGRR